MAGIKDYSTTNLNNTSLNGISVAEGMLPSQLNNAIRALMVNTRSWFNDSQWVEYGDGDGAYTAAYASATSFTIAGVDVTPIYHEGRRIKLIASTPGTIYGTISSSTFSTNTTVNVTWDSGSLSNEAITNVYIGALSKTNNSLPTGVIATATLADGSVTTIKIADSAVTTAKINDAAVTNAKLGADSVNGSKIADDSIDSEHYVDGSIDTVHIADSQITTAKIADTAITTAKITDSNVTNSKLATNSVTAVKITDANITTAKIADDAIDGTKIADDSINSEHYVDGSIDTQHIADSQITTAKIADSNVTTAKIADSNVTTAKINNDAVTAAKIADAVIVTNAEQSGHTPDDVTFFTTSASDGRYFRQDSSETIDSGDTWSGSDAFIATTAAIDARVIDLVDDVGGFFPISSETNFPNTNPDVNDGAGTIVSIKEMATTRTPSGGTVTISGGTVGGSTVTITGCGSTVLTAGFGVLVETTTTLNTYTFHRLVPKATEVTTVAAISSDITTVAGDTTDIGVVSGLSSDIQALADIEDGTTATNAISNVGNNISSVVTTASNISGVNSFADRYRVSSSAPTTSLDSGDLYFDTSTNILNVYGASGWQNAGSSVNGTSQRYNYTATNAQTTFTGADNNGNTLAYDAGYIDVYLNGVKLLNGTDVTVTSGSSVVLASGATTGDVVDIVAYGTFSVASLNADNLDSGTVPDARITGTYTGITGLDLTDNSKIRLGTGNDLQIYHDGTQSQIADVGTGNLKIRATNLEINNSADTQQIIQAFDGGAVNLFHNGAVKLGTTSTGATITGSATVTGGLAVAGDATVTGYLAVDTNTLYVDSANNRVGVGTVTPSSKLEVTGGATINYNMRNTLLDNNGEIVSFQWDNNAYFTIQGRDSNAGFKANWYRITSTATDGYADEHIWYTDSSAERMRIDSSGNLLVGKTSDAFAGEGLVFSPGSASSITRDNGNVLSLRRDTSEGNIIQLYKDTTNVGSIGIVNTNNLFIQGDSTNSGLQCGTNTILPVQNGANASNTIDMGDASNLWKDLYLGGGLYVGGTGTANKLDDYEEGTFTPDVYHSSSNNSTWTSVNGEYTKIGNTVTCQIRVDSGNTGTAGSDLTIGGLPFAANQAQANMGIGSWGSNPNSQVGNVFGSNPPKLAKGGTTINTQMTFVTITLVYKTNA